MHQKKINTIKRGIVGGTEYVHLKPITRPFEFRFPEFLKHEYAKQGIEPFRFIHWNIQAVPKEMAKDV